MSVKPVVAITTGTWFSLAYFKIFKVATGTEKSIITSGFSSMFEVFV